MRKEALPPGTSKWHKIEHRRSRSSRATGGGHPLADYRTIVEFIDATTSPAGLTVRCQFDENLYPSGINVSDQGMAARRVLAVCDVAAERSARQWESSILPTTGG